MNSEEISKKGTEENSCPKGSVTLVGAGCGKNLITVAGQKALQEAETVVYDDLIDPDLLWETRPECRLVYVGKRLGKHSSRQQDINRILVEEAAEGKNVVRLKGGDSFVFGRGGEEVMALQKAQILYRLIPGVTSGVAVPENAGIPVTHRKKAQTVTFITGHAAESFREDYHVLAGLNGTLVFFMGLHALPDLCDRLMEAGKDPKTPASVISHGFAADQMRIDGTLADISEKSRQAQTPALIVIGSMADMHLESTVHRPLDHVSVAVTGTRYFTKRLSGLLSEMGAETRCIPCLQIEPDFSDIPADFKEYSWVVFTSANGVDIFFDYLRQNRIDIRSIAHLKFAVIGRGTSLRLMNHGIRADFCPSVFTAEMLGKELPQVLAETDRILILRAQNGSADLTRELSAADADFDDRKIYRTLAPEWPVFPVRQEPDYLVFASASGVRAFFDSGIIEDATVPVCIGPSTEKEFEKFSDRIPLVPEEHTVSGIAQVICDNVHRRGQDALQQTDSGR